MKNNGEKLSTVPSASRARGVCHTLESYGVINNPVFVIPRACASARVRSDANLKAWREKKFGGDFDPVAAIVDEAVAELSKGQPETDRRLWLKIANVIGWEKFADLLDEMRSILQSRHLRNPAAAFHKRLQAFKPKGGAK